MAKTNTVKLHFRTNDPDASLEVTANGEMWPLTLPGPGYAKDGSFVCQFDLCDECMKRDIPITGESVGEAKGEQKTGHETVATA